MLELRDGTAVAEYQVDEGSEALKAVPQYPKDQKYDVRETLLNLNGCRPAHSLLDGARLFFREAFLPQGYPDSVSVDYLQYQIWDTAQAFCSSITGMAVMPGKPGLTEDRQEC